MKTYSVKESFRTIQGEGYHAGTPALFIRFAGCNMWSGLESHRVADYGRTGAKCPLWCDTDFRGGTKESAVQVAGRVEREPRVPLIVLTGGEPLLQVDEELLDALREAAPFSKIAVETNGTIAPLFSRPGYRDDSSFGAGARDANARAEIIPWITLSPKLPRAQTKLAWANELKLVVPAYDMAEWDSYPADHRYAQPQAQKDQRDLINEKGTALIVAASPGGRWKLSLQQHKILGLP